MSIDTEHWTQVSTQKPTFDFLPLKAAGTIVKSGHLIESFLVQFLGMPPNLPERLYRSKLVLRAHYEPTTRKAYSQTEEIWIKPSFIAQEIQIPFPDALIAAGLTSRSFEIKKWNRYGKNGVGRVLDADWSITLWESIYQQDSVPPNYGSLPPTDWNWIPPGYNTP